ncbi:multidrug effflux MFS transporter [Streptomyces sp. DSM 44917]|uniref:Multidrug effflux MFS transporter n=1 Tax=Streptomyces boetiae TaxID=3075541 RepID=A0ABU2L3Q8_9ACTN|nr:multidrug effflux MFS transporter [Streptomyces sp. DSM 44917]MDT0306200.1 multidrug effflux MFS transporter [Streptomyces sp. DSM 44917]
MHQPGRPRPGGGVSGEDPTAAAIPTAIPGPTDPGTTDPGPTDPRTASPRPVPPTPPAAGRRAGPLLVLVLGSLTAVSPLSMDLYLPALPDIADDLGTGASSVQLTLTACLLGLALGQLLAGPLSDQFGRRRPLMAGMSCYALASVACALAPSAGALTACRLLQGLTGAAGVVIARAVVRDLYEGVAMARFFSSLMLISGAAPVLAPVAGGQLMRVTDWRGIFLVLAAAGVLLVAAVARLLPETLPPARRNPSGLLPALRTMGGLCRDRVFTGHLLVASLTMAAVFSYISASPFVVQEIHGASPQAFSLLFMLNSLAMVATSQINGKLLVGRFPMHRITAAGLGLMLLAAASLLVMTSGALGRAGLVPVSAGLFLMMGAMPLVMPNANTEALTRTPHAAGSAAALLGAAAFFVSALVTPLVGVAGEDTAVPMALVQLGLAVLAIAAFLLLCRPRRTARRGARAGRPILGP